MTDQHPTPLPPDRPDLPVSARVALVTGAARGIGLAVARRLAEAGHPVVLADVRDEVVAAAGALSADGLPATGVQADVTSVSGVQAMVEAATGRFGPVGVLVNNAALTAVHRDWTTVTPEDWDRVLEVNLKSCFLCFRAVYDHMRAARWGRVVNISSVTFLTGQRRLLDYVTSKGGVVGFTRALAREVGGDGITVNAVSPGAIRTEAELEMFGDSGGIPPEQSVPRRGLPSDIAAAVAFLCSDSASFVSGQLLNVDGGWVMH